MSNRLFQGVIHQMKDAVDRIVGVFDESENRNFMEVSRKWIVYFVR